MRPFNDHFETTARVSLGEEIQQRISDSLSNGAKVKSITVKMEATHSGRPNGNNWIYTPKGMYDGYRSFVSPVFKPVTEEHNPDSRTLGRVISSKYVDYGNISDSFNSLSPVEYLGKAKELNLDKQYRSRGYKGLGHIELVAKITDKEAIDKILDGEFGFVSVDGRVEEAYCSICSTKVNSPNRCEHRRGVKYGNEKCYYVGGKMHFDHISYVATPADSNAVATLIRDSKNSQSHLQILDFEIEKGKQMTVGIQDINKSSEHLVEHAKTLGIKDYQLPSEEGLTVLDYVFGEQKTFPISDKLSASLAKSYFTTKISDSGDKESIITLIDEKLQELGVEDYEQVIADAIKASEEPKEAEKVSDNVEQGLAQAEFDQDALVEKVAVAISDKIQALIAGNANSYLNSQNKVLRQELANKTIELVKVQDALKESVVSQISAIEKISDSVKIEELKKRSLESLSDKLKDLQAAKTDTTEKVSDSVEKDTKEPLEKDSVKIEDSADTTTVEEPKDVKIEDGLIFENKIEAQKEFLKVLNKEGAAAAKAFAAKVKIKSES
nr:MAG TPA: hypothetical protein [Bacteriophage sp.]